MQKKSTEKKPRLHIVLDNIRSAYNVGSFFRTADATGCAKLYLCGMTSYPPNPRIDKTALGAVESVPWEYFKTTTDAIKKLKSAGIPVFSVEIASGSVNYKDIEYPNPVALVFGHEVNGVGQPVLSLSDKIVQIPMNGIKNSLNVATVAGIMMFEAIRKD